MKVTENVDINSGKRQRQDAEGCTIARLHVKFMFNRNLPLESMSYIRLAINPHHICWILLTLLPFGGCSPAKVATEDGGFVSIFDGKTLRDWDGDPTYWRVEDGNLVGEVTPATILKRNSFIIWRGGLTKDFELKVEYRVSAEGNSGINYRSEEVEGVSYALRGYQCDIDGANRYTGMNYEERRRTTIARQGQVVHLDPVEDNTQPLSTYIKDNQWTRATLKGSLGNIDSLKATIKRGEWNQVHLIVKGNRLRHYINGVLMSDVTDNDTINRSFSGLLGVQVHVGPPMKIEYRNFRIKRLL